jgi:hypothetical protein
VVGLSLSLQQLSGIHALKLVDCSYGSYLFMDYTCLDFCPTLFFSQDWSFATNFIMPTHLYQVIFGVAFQAGLMTTREKRSF